MKFTDDDCSEGFPCGEPGEYEGEVIDVKERVTQNDGDEMWSLQFKDVQTGETICFDNLVFSKKGAGIAYTKLKQLGLSRNEAGFYECESSDLIGLRATLILKKDTYKDVDKLVPDFNAENFGYKMNEDGVPF